MEIVLQVLGSAVGAIVGYIIAAWGRRRKRERRPCFPKPRFFLTRDEYLREGIDETRKALEDLRAYCRSPKCDVWRTISRLESPSRFAEYIEGASDVTDEQASLHEIE